MTATPEPRAMLDRCRSTCRWSRCTGKGGTSHRCPFGPPPPPPMCNVCDDLAVDRFLPGWRCVEHAPDQPPRSPSSVPSPSAHRTPYAYGTATTDPPRVTAATLDV